MSANLGLVPRQHSSGDKPDHLLRWAVRLQQRKGHNVAAVALANKMARVI